MTRILIMAVAVAVMNGCTSPSEGSDREPWLIHEYPSGTLRLEQSPPFGYGIHTIHVAFQPRGGAHPIDLGSTGLQNDGANLGPHNFQMLPDTAADAIGFALIGEEQANMHYWIRGLREGKPRLESPAEK